MADNYRSFDMHVATGDTISTAFSKLNINFSLIPLKPSVNVINDLPNTENSAWDIRLVVTIKLFYIWNPIASQWERLSEDLQVELNNTQIGAGLESDGGYDSDQNTNYLKTASSLKNADTKLDSKLKEVENDLGQNTADLVQDLIDEATTRGNADSALQDELDNTQLGSGLENSGDYSSDPATNYLKTASTLKDADKKLDSQIKVNEISISDEVSRAGIAETGLQNNIGNEALTRGNADTTLQNELDNTQIGAGLESDGSYDSDQNTNFLTEASGLKDADKKLDSQIKVNEIAISDEISRAGIAESDLQGNINNLDNNLQNELDDTQIGGGLEDDGSYDSDQSTNYLKTASTLKDADKKLDSAINNEVIARGNADTTLQENVDTEATTRGNADTTLQENIGDEVIVRGDADTILQENIDDLASERVLSFRQEFQDTVLVTITIPNLQLEDIVSLALETSEGDPDFFIRGFVKYPNDRIVVTLKTTSGTTSWINCTVFKPKP